MDLFNNPLQERREELLDYADRYERGATYDNISEEEAVTRYCEVATELSGEDYRYSACEAFSQMEPEERVQLGKRLRDQSL
jgi:predicted transcriptional regulator